MRDGILFESEGRRHAVLIAAEHVRQSCPACGHLFVLKQRQAERRGCGQYSDTSRCQPLLALLEEKQGDSDDEEDRFIGAN
jgi:ssDNA-binding Zn-finger/Zn-ribbon topoisomerase 1